MWAGVGTIIADWNVEGRLSARRGQHFWKDRNKLTFVARKLPVRPFA